MQVFDEETRSDLVPLVCGSYMTSRYLTAHRSISVVFKTDGSVVNRGFTLEVYVQPGGKIIAVCTG